MQGGEGTAAYLPSTPETVSRTWVPERELYREGGEYRNERDSSMNREIDLS